MADQRHYESTVIINGSLEEKQISDAVERISEFIAKHDGEISETDHWGRKRMTYAINKKNNGYYVQFKYNAPGDIIAQFSRFCRIDDDILRELTLVLTERDLRKREETKQILAEAEAAAAEEAADSKGKDDGR